MVASVTLPPGVSAQCYYFDGEPFFGGDPHPPPYLYFDENVLVSLVMIGGQLGRRVTPPDCIYHVGDLEVWSQHQGCPLGCWTVVSDHDEEPGSNRGDVAVVLEKDKIAERLPGMRIKYGQFATGKSWLWLLTEERLGPPLSFLRNEWGNPVTVRLGRWPD